MDIAAYSVLRLAAAVLACAAIGSPAIGQGNPPAPKPRPPGISRQDDRLPVDFKSMPWRAIGKVQTNIGGGCTGILVGPRHVLTAGHCFYNPRTQRLLQPGSIHFLAGYDRGEYEAHTTVTAVAHSPDLEKRLREKRAGFVEDWAILTLAQPLGRRFGTLAIAPGPLAVRTPVKAAGYGMDRRHILTGDMDCRIVHPSGPRSPLIAHDCETTRGNSGGPLLVEQDGATYVAGLVIALDNRGRGEWLGIAVDVAGLRPRIAALQN